MGRPISPQPVDWEAGEAFVREEYDADELVCRTWLANHRADLVRMSAVAAMQKRQEAEWKARFARPVNKVNQDEAEHVG